ncbi:hypothetical protein Trydic_g6189 [Trypoxylus dichotomus]
MRKSAENHNPGKQQSHCSKPEPSAPNREQFYVVDEIAIADNGIALALPPLNREVNAIEWEDAAGHLLQTLVSSELVINSNEIAWEMLMLMLSVKAT